MSFRVVPLSDFDMPVCPLCDNGLSTSELVEVVQTRRGSLGLVHSLCLADALGESEESDDTPDGDMYDDDFQHRLESDG